MNLKEQLQIEKNRAKELRLINADIKSKARSAQQALENRAYKAFYLKIKEDIKILDHLSTVLEQPQTHMSVNTIKQYLNEFEQSVNNN